MITKNTPIEELKFPLSWRFFAAVQRYNESVDLNTRILTVKDIVQKGKDLISLLGIGPKTQEEVFKLLKENKLWEL
jgi:hypothetical protein